MAENISPLELSKLYKSLGSTHIIDDVSAQLVEGEFLVIVGPSGCGKTTLLRIMAGLLPPDKGAVYHKGKTFSGPPSGIALVFQDYTRSLFPWLSVHRNVGFGLRCRKRDRKSRITEALKAVDLDGTDRYYPWQLSGGMQQRVALARAVAALPDVLLLDEPFAAVDAQTRMDLQSLVATVCAKYSISTILVTHDIDEAIFLGDRVLTLSNRPATVSSIISVNLPRPRNQIETKGSSEFDQLRRSIYKHIRSAKTDESRSRISHIDSAQKRAI